jgi:hypothetical protein
VLADAKICARSDLSGLKYDIDLLSFVSFGQGSPVCVDADGGSSCAAAVDWTSFLVTPSDGVGDACTPASKTAGSGTIETVSTVPTAAGVAGVTATLNNTGGSDAAVTVQNLGHDPGPATANPFNVGGQYVDLHVTGADLSDTVTASFYYPTTVTGPAEAALQLSYFTGSIWTAVLSSGGIPPGKDTTDDLDGTVSGGRFTVTFDGTSTPTVVELTGTVFTSALPGTIDVTIDIKPGDFPNSINTSKKGVIPVAVLGTPTFNPAAVDLSTVCFGDAENPGERACEVAPGTVFEDVNGDLILDLVLHFRTQETGIDPGDTQACLTGKLSDGTSIEGCDSVKAKK